MRLFPPLGASKRGDSNMPAVTAYLDTSTWSAIERQAGDASVQLLRSLGEIGCVAFLVSFETLEEIPLRRAHRAERIASIRAFPNTYFLAGTTAYDLLSYDAAR